MLTSNGSHLLLNVSIHSTDSDELIYRAVDIDGAILTLSFISAICTLYIFVSLGPYIFNLFRTAKPYSSHVFMILCK